MTKQTNKQQATLATHSLNKAGKKQGGFVAMPLVGVLLMLGVGGTAAISESNRSNEGNGIVKTPVHQPQVTSGAIPAVNDQVASFFEEIE